MPSNSGPRGLVTMVCITCGAEQFFDTAVPSSITCERCGSTVFRQFATPTEPDEATISQLEEQARSISYGDSSPQTSPDEVRELGNG
jgi:DNA-directed RNA polymerase subunit RPC12/RpoP